MAACVKGENDLAECDPCCCRSHITTMITTNAHEISLERGRLWIVLATIVINIVAVSLLTFAPWSDWRTGAVLNAVDNRRLCTLQVRRVARAISSLWTPGRLR